MNFSGVMLLDIYHLVHDHDKLDHWSSAELSCFQYLTALDCT